MDSFKDPNIFFSRLASLDAASLLEFIDSWQSFRVDDLKPFLDFILTQIKPLDLKMALYDCCGTGGDKTNTLNISTTAAIIAAAAGVHICKNGGRSSSSNTGSVDVLEALGLNLGASFETKTLGLKNHNLAFYSSPVSAELLAPIKQICKQNKRTSFLSLIAPFASPVMLEGQVIGVGHESWIGTMVDLAAALIKEGKRKHILIVHSTYEALRFDEFTSFSKAQVIELSPDHKIEFEFNPADLNLECGVYKDLLGSDSHKGNAELINQVLKNSANQASKNTAALNAAATLYLSLYPRSLSYEAWLENMLPCVEKCQSVIHSGLVHKNWLRFLMSQNSSL